MERMGGGRRLGLGGGGGGGGDGGGSGGGGGRDRPYSVGGSSNKEEEAGKKTDDRLVPAISYTRPPPLRRQARNYAVLDLNGSTIEIRYRWRRTVLKYRLWCFNTSNLRYEFGDSNRRCCTLPEEGHFLIYMHYDGKWLCAVIDVAAGYLDGYITRSFGTTKDDLRICESNAKNAKYIQHAKKLPWDGGYMYAMYRKSGDGSLVESFLVLYAHVEGQVPGPSREEIIRAGETFVLHFPEAGRSDSLYTDNIFKNFRAGNMVGKKAIRDARVWKSNCTTIYHALGIRDDEFGDKPKDTRHTHSRERLTKYSDAVVAKAMLEDIRLLHRPNLKRGYFELKNMPMHLSKEGPVNPKWAENELTESHKLDLNDQDWGFLMHRFPPFPSQSNEGRTQTLLKNAYWRTEDAMIDKGMVAMDFPDIPDLAITKPGNFDKHRIAYHESGHAIVALYTQGAHPIHKVTILPEGSSLGMVTQVASRGDVSTGMKEMLARLDICLGGRVAEEIMFNEEMMTPSGAENDLVTARSLAQNMVSNCCSCTSDSADPMHVEESPGGKMQVDKLLKESYDRVKLLLNKHVKQLEAVANALLEEETLTVHQILKIVHQHRPFNTLD
ncbi:unnamed protein product [Urochloa decumbens]|uniref:Peptidase M41 domain-containing protein n=1 Tax=Urochloa decumbens TaxID=240449 RepID=A0ABC8VX69_9POAL